MNANNKAKKLLNDSYGHHYKNLNTVNETQYHSNMRNYQDVLSNILPKDKNAPIVDIGCGVGFLFYYFNKKGYKNIVGVDTSSNQLKETKKYCSNSSITILNKNGCDFLKSNNEKFEQIFMFDLIEHIEKSQIISLLTDAYSALKPHGHLIIRTPNMSSPFASYSRYMDFTHEIGLTEHSIKQVFRATPFSDNTKLVKPNDSSHFLRKGAKWGYYSLCKFLYFIQNRPIPKTLEPNLILIAEKSVK